MEPRLERWMLAEKDEEDAAADAAFLAVMSAMPRIEAGPGFAARLDVRLTKARARRRAIMLAGRAAAILLIAMCGNLVIAGIAGGLVPLQLERLGFDPAVASSIFVTTFTDTGGFFIFLGLATLAMRFIGA